MRCHHHRPTAKATVKAEYVQRGETLDYKNTTTKPIPCDTIIAIGGRVGVTGGEIKPGELGSLHMVGVFRVKKSSEEEIAQGQDLVFDGTGAAPTPSDTDTVSEGDGDEDETTTLPAPTVTGIPMGYAAAPSEASDPYVLVKLPG